MNSRKEEHFKQAKRFYLGLTSVGKINGQVAAITNCWVNGGNVTVVQFGNEYISCEAHCREAALIETIAGTMYGEMNDWSEEKIRN